jgi:transposase
MSRRRGLWSLDQETFAENWATILTFGQLAERDSSVIRRPAQRNAAPSLATYSDSQVKMEKSDLWRKDFMYREVAQWRYIRRLIREKGTPKKQVSRETGISRQTINKMLTLENPPSYGPRPLQYPRLGPYISAIDRILHDALSLTPAADVRIQDIVERLRRSEGFAGSYDSVRNYIRHRARDDESAWEQAYGLVVQLPKARALDFIRLLSRGDPPILTSARLRPFVREAACPRKPQTRPNRERQRLADVEWMRRVLQKEVTDDVLHRELDDLPDLCVLLKHLRNGRLLDRNRAMVALASHRRIPRQTICAFLGVGKAFVRKYLNKFDTSGAETMFAPQSRSTRMIDNEDLRNAVFSLLHEPPTNHGINRTSWTMPLLSQVLKKNGRQIGPALISKMIKAAGYKMA